MVKWDENCQFIPCYKCVFVVLVCTGMAYDNCIVMALLVNWMHVYTIAPRHGNTRANNSNNYQSYCYSIAWDRL